VGAPLRRVARACLVHQDFAHQTSGNGKKMRAVLGSQRSLSHEPQIGLMHQGGALQSLMVLARQTSPSQAAQFVVNDRDEGLSGRRVTMAPSGEQLRNLVG